MRRISILAVVAVLAIAASTASSYSRNPEPDRPSEEHDFGDKIVMVVTRPTYAQGDNGGGHITKVKVRRLGDRHFIVGQTPVEGANEKHPLAQIWLPLQDVTNILEYDTWEDAMRDHEARVREQEEWDAKQRNQAPRPAAPIQEPEVVPQQPPPTGN